MTVSRQERGLKLLSSQPAARGLGDGHAPRPALSPCKCERARNGCGPADTGRGVCPFNIKQEGQRSGDQAEECVGRWSQRLLQAERVPQSGLPLGWAKGNRAGVGAEVPGAARGGATGRGPRGGALAQDSVSLQSGQRGETN